MVTANAAMERRPMVLSDLLPGRLARDVALVVCGAAFTGALAQVSVPVHGSPVPITGQTLGALLVGAGLGSRRGFAALALYLFAGMAGVPWFSDHSHGTGLPTLGYIVGFVFAAAAVGALAAHGGDRTPLRVVATMVTGNVIIYACGVPYLMADLHINFATAWDLGVQNYLPGDGIKVLIAAALLPACWGVVARKTGHHRTR